MCCCLCNFDFDVIFFGKTAEAEAEAEAEAYSPHHPLLLYFSIRPSRSDGRIKMTDGVMLIDGAVITTSR